MCETRHTYWLQKTLKHSRYKISYIKHMIFFNLTLWCRNLVIFCCHMCHVSLKLHCIQLTPSKILPADTCINWLLALQMVATFLQPKWKHLIILWVSPPSASPVKILLLYTSLPPCGSSSRAVTVTFDYGLEGKEQQHNNLISNRWLRSSKGLFCLGACSSDWPGMQTDQRPPEHGGSAALPLTAQSL